MQPSLSVSLVSHMPECAHVLVHIFGSPESQDCLNGVQKLTISWYAKARQGLCTRGAGPKLGDQKQRRADTGEAQEKQRRAGRRQGPVGGSLRRHTDTDTDTDTDTEAEEGRQGPVGGSLRRLHRH